LTRSGAKRETQALNTTGLPKDQRALDRKRKNNRRGPNVTTEGSLSSAQIKMIVLTFDRWGYPWEQSKSGEKESDGRKKRSKSRTRDPIQKSENTIPSSNGKTRTIE